MALYAIEAVRWDANGTVSKLRWSPHWIDGSVPEYGVRAEVAVEEALAAIRHGAQAQPLVDGQFGPAVRPAQRLDGTATITDDEHVDAGRDLASLPTF